MIDVAVATSVNLPSSETQNELLLAALARRGLSSTRIVWSEVASAPETLPHARALLLWSIDEEEARTEEFHQWVDRVDTENRLVNEVGVLRRERDKRYLEELDAAEVPTVPSLWCRADRSSIDYLADRVDWKAFVLKSARGGQVFGFDRDSLQAGQEHLESIDGDALLQPYLGQVQNEGVLAMNFVGGEFSHAMRMYPAEGEWRTDERVSRFEAAEPEGTQFEIATLAANALAPRRGAPSSLPTLCVIGPDIAWRRSAVSSDKWLFSANFFTFCT